MRIPKENVRLAQAKPLEARTYVEMVAAVFGYDEPDSQDYALQFESMTYDDVVASLKGRRGDALAIAEMLTEVRRRKNPSTVQEKTIQSVNDIAAQSLDIRDKKKEYLVAFFLNARQQLICKEIISIGTLTASLAHPREIFAPAIGKAAAAVVLVHNHPSGDPSPSDEDIRLTKRIQQAGHILGIELLDHLIVAESGCYSFKTSGAL